MAVRPTRCAVLALCITAMELVALWLEGRPEFCGHDTVRVCVIFSNFIPQNPKNRELPVKSTLSIACMKLQSRLEVLQIPSLHTVHFETYSYNNIQESHTVAGKPHDAAVNSDRYQVCWHFAGAISAGVLGQFSAQYKSDLHVLLTTYLFTCLLTAHYYYNSHYVQCALSRSVRSVHCRLLSFHFVSSFICIDNIAYTPVYFAVLEF